jgi:hypothetical protein
VERECYLAARFDSTEEPPPQPLECNLAENNSSRPSQHFENEAGLFMAENADRRSSEKIINVRVDEELAQLTRH